MWKCLPSLGLVQVVIIGAIIIVFAMSTFFLYVSCFVICRVHIIVVTIVNTTLSFFYVNVVSYCLC